MNREVELGRKNGKSLTAFAEMMESLAEEASPEQQQEIAQVLRDAGFEIEEE